MKAVSIFLLSLVVAYANYFSYEEEVIVLTDHNHIQAFYEFDYTLVAFFRACDHCKKFAPEYDLAAQKLSESHPQVKFAKVDAKTQNILPLKYNITSYPTIKLFIKGSVLPADQYQGELTTQGIINWLETKLQGRTQEINSFDDIEKTVSETRTVGLFLGASNSNKNYAKFLAITLAFSEIVFINTNDGEVKKKFGTDQDTLIVFSNFGEENHSFKGPFGVETLRSFIEAHRVPTVMLFNEDVAHRIFDEGREALFLIVADNEEGKKAERAFRAVAPEVKDLVALSIVKFEDPDSKRFLEFLGVPEEELPAIRIAQRSDKLRKFALQQELTTENIRNFVNDYKNNNLKLAYRSQSIPKEPYDNNVRVLVGKTFNQIVLDETKDVLVLFYAPWCNFCRDLQPIFASFAGRLKNIENLIIAKIDITANEIENLSISNFPTILFYTRNNKASPVQYNGINSEQGFIDFLKEQATIQIPTLQITEQIEETPYREKGMETVEELVEKSDQKLNEETIQKTTEETAEQLAEKQQRFSEDL